MYSLYPGWKFTNLDIQSEAMVDPGRHNEKIPLDNFHPDPLVIHIPHVKIAASIQNQSDFLVNVNMLLKKHLQLEQAQGSLSKAQHKLISLQNQDDSYIM